VTPFDYDYLRRMLKERSGFVLAPAKEYLVENRLAPVVRRHGHSCISGLVQAMRAPAAESLRIEVTEAMMNNESFFFRDRVPFDRRRRDFTVSSRCSAACRSRCSSNTSRK
jgi:chemotaxis protein methyltransferase CheR